MRPLLLLLLALFPLQALQGAEARVAVASNFADTARLLAERFQARSGHRVRLSSASSGKLYAQIRNGAPFDLFLSADARRPRKLVEAGLALPESRRTYALGRLVFWAPGTTGDAAACRKQLEKAGRLAMANPRTAPYGAAAAQVLEALGIRPEKRVLGENVAQAHAFTASRAVDGGLVAAAQLQGQEPEGCRWPVPESLHAPIEQQMVLLQRGKKNPAALAFHRFLLSREAAALIEAAGYQRP